MAAKFVIKKGSGGQFHFNLVAANGEIVATSERYTTKVARMVRLFLRDAAARLDILRQADGHTYSQHSPQGL